MRNLAVIALLSLPLMGCDDSAARQKNSAKLTRAIQEVMCSDSADERSSALGRVVELASHETDGDAWVFVEDTAADVQCGDKPAS